MALPVTIISGQGEPLGQRWLAGSDYPRYVVLSVGDRRIRCYRRSAGCYVIPDWAEELCESALDRSGE